MEDKIFSSLTADSELKSILESIDKGEYKHCSREIDKKMKKLKKEGDILNFKIVKMLLLHKTKAYEESKTLKTEIRNSLNSIKNEDILRFFKNTLKDIGDDSTLAEMYKNTLKNKNMTEISKEEQVEILKELTIYSEFNEMYKTLNVLIEKNLKKDRNFLVLLKYEILFILCVKLKKLPQIILNKTLKELSSDSTVVNQKGYIDLMIKYYMNNNDTLNLQSFLEKNIEQFANAPLKDLLCEMYYRQNDLTTCINFIIKEILTNMEKCYFTYYQRLVCLTVLSLEKENFNFASLNEGFIKGASDNQSNFDLNNFSFQINKGSENLSNLISFLYHIASVYLTKNFNSFKSSILSLLLLFHLLVVKGKNQELYSRYFVDLLKSLLTHTINKQSIFMEISPFFIYLNHQMRKEIYEEFSKKENLSKDEQIFAIKLEKLFGLFSFNYNQEDEHNIKLLKEKISSLFEVYQKMVYEVNKIEKGERVVGDDIIIIINEYLFELYNQTCNRNPSIIRENKQLQELLLLTLYINNFAHDKSIYNYDITIYLIKVSGMLNLNSILFEKFKYMNLKGPQFETVSYFFFPFLYLDPTSSANVYLIKNFERWQKENRRSVKQTLWKMFHSVNFWNSDELIDFETEENKSFYKHILNYGDICLNFTSKFDKLEREEMFKQISRTKDLLAENYNLLENNLKTLRKNQDLFVTYPKYKNVEYINGEFGTLSTNINYSAINYQFSIDSVNKDNIVFLNYPSYRNNYFNQNEVDIFGCFNNVEFLQLRNLVHILCYSLENKEEFLKYYKIIKSIYTNVYNETNFRNIHSSQRNNYYFFSRLDNLFITLFNCYNDCLTDINTLSNHTDNIKSACSIFEEEIRALQDLRSRLSSDFNLLGFNEFNSKLQIIMNFYCDNIALLLYHFLNLITVNSKVLQNTTQEIKNILSNKLKNVLSNFINENIQSIDKLNGLEESTNNLPVIKGYESLRNNLSRLVVDEISRLIKEIKDFSRRKRDFIKNLI